MCLEPAYVCVAEVTVFSVQSVFLKSIAVVDPTLNIGLRVLNASVMLDARFDCEAMERTMD